MGRGLCGENRFFACPTGDCFPLAQLGPQPSRWRLCRLTDGEYLLRFWTPKKKRWTSGNDYGLRYNRTLVLCCYGIPRVKDFGVSFCFRRPGFERPVVPFAPLPLSGWNTAPCSLVFTPPGWVIFVGEWESGDGGLAHSLLRNDRSGRNPAPSLLPNPTKKIIINPTQNRGEAHEYSPFRS